MKNLFYKDWAKKRTNKIINIFGESWFDQKEILELAACYGDIGKELLNLNSSVTFTDARQDHIDQINKYFLDFHFSPDSYVLNQEKSYILKKKYDLILHLGVLYHIKNWKNDLKCLSNYTDRLILETIVNPVKGAKDSYVDFPTPGCSYGPYNKNSKMSYVTQESVERQLRKLGYKFIRFDNSELNSKGWILDNCSIHHIYNWTYDDINKGMYKYDEKNIFHHRRFWLAIK